MKAISLTVLIAAMFLAFASDAEAQETYRRAKSHHGAIMSGKDPDNYAPKRCPVRTCSQAGTSTARDIRNCSAANCRK